MTTPQIVGGTRGAVNTTTALVLGSTDQEGTLQLRSLFLSVVGGTNPVMFTITGLQSTYLDKPFTLDDIDPAVPGQISYQIPPNGVLPLVFPDNHFILGGPQITVTFTAGSGQYASVTATGNYL
jgi:hypothetical protein